MISLMLATAPLYAQTAEKWLGTATGVRATHTNEPNLVVDSHRVLSLSLTHTHTHTDTHTHISGPTCQHTQD